MGHPATEPPICHPERSPEGAESKDPEGAGYTSRLVAFSQVWPSSLCGEKGVERRSGDQRHGGPFGFAQGRLFDCGAHGEAVSTFAQDDRVLGV